jgi:hypothetical protein
MNPGYRSMRKKRKGKKRKERKGKERDAHIKILGHSLKVQGRKMGGKSNEWLLTIS